MELFRALAVLSEPPQAGIAHIAAALELGPLPQADEHTELFVFQLYPYASVYLGSEGMMGGEARDRVAGFWRALGQLPPAEPDHLAVMLALYAQLCEMEEGERDAMRRASGRRARKAFLWEHLLSWLPVYLIKLADVATPFYRRWGKLLMQALLEEADNLGKQDALPLHLRESTGLSDPRTDEAGEFLQSLLSPVRSGMILVRADLTRAGRILGVGLRMGERKFILKSLFGQDASKILGWLSEEASQWRERHSNNRPLLGEIAEVWERKAEATAKLLAELSLAAK
jgi:TorA maturation chaperone TorD